MGPIPIVAIFSPDPVRVVMSTSRHTKKGGFYSALLPWLGTGLLTSEGAKWKSRRRLITPAFHFDILKRFLEVMNEQTDVMVDIIEARSQQGPVEVTELVTLCALDIIAETAMGKRIDAQRTKEKNKYVEAVSLAATLISDRMEEPWTAPDIIYMFTPKGRRNERNLKVLHEFTRGFIRERKALLAQQQLQSQFDGSEEEIGKKVRPAFLDILLAAEEDGKPIDDEDIREEVDTFMFEGTDFFS